MKARSTDMVAGHVRPSRRRNHLLTRLKLLLPFTSPDPQPDNGEDGQSLVETALSLMLSITTCFWVFEFSMFAYTLSVLNDAAQEGVRYAMMHGSDSANCSGPTTGCNDTSGANVVAVAKSTSGLSLHNISNIQIVASYPESTGSKPGSLVKVTIQYTYIPYINLPGIGKTATLNAQGRIIF